MTTETIEFWRTRDDHGWMSNFYPAPFRTLDGRVWSTSEHFFQSQKFAGTDREELIRLAASPMDAANMGRDRAFCIRPDWEEVKEEVMYTAIKMKFTQNPELLSRLLATGNALLVEASPKDDYWGYGPDKRGRNRLGILLTALRAELRRKGNGND